MAFCRCGYNVIGVSNWLISRVVMVKHGCDYELKEADIFKLANQFTIAYMYNKFLLKLIALRLSKNSIISRNKIPNSSNQFITIPNLGFSFLMGCYSGRLDRNAQVAKAKIL